MSRIGCHQWQCLMVLSMVVFVPSVSANTPSGTGTVSTVTVPTGYRQIAGEYGVPAALFYAIALTESQRTIKIDGKRVSRPWPWTLNVAGQGYYFESRGAAWQVLKRGLAKGKRSIDIGLMQVNWRYNSSLLKNPYKALDPYYNLRIAAHILRDCYRKTNDWWMAVGCYHAPGKDTASQKRAARYRTRVLGHWRRISG